MRAALRWTAPWLLLALAGCGDEPAPEAAQPAPALSAERPQASPRAAPVAPTPAPEPVPVIDACALIPASEAASIIGRPLHTEPLPAQRGHAGTFAACQYAAGPGPGPRRALRLELTTARSFALPDTTLDGWWQSRTLGDSSARRVEALGGQAFWVKEPPPVRRLLLVRGRHGVYALSSMYYGRNALDARQLEALAAALLAAE